jgi:hypothetical protein
MATQSTLWARRTMQLLRKSLHYAREGAPVTHEMSRSVFSFIKRHSLACEILCLEQRSFTLADTVVPLAKRCAS